jgi:hypothetical protein
MKQSWMIHDMIRICPQTGSILETEVDDIFKPVLLDEPLVLVTPRNAYLSMQIIVRTNKDDTDEISIYADPLLAVNIEFNQIAATDYTYYVQWYHHIESKYVPDGLIPWKAGRTAVNPVKQISQLNDIPNQAYAAIWVDLFIPADTVTGDYMGNLYVRKGENVDSHIITVKVLNTVVPNEASIIADLNCYADSLSPQYQHLKDQSSRYRDGSYFDVEKQYFQMAHEHRALFHSLPYSHSGNIPESFAPELEGAGKTLTVKDWSLFDEHFGPYLDGSAFKDSKRGAIPVPYFYLPQNFHWPADYTKFGRKGYHTEFSRILAEFHDHFTDKGWLDTKFELFLNHKKRYKLFPYDGDETRFVWDEKINDIYYAFGEDVLNRKEGAQIIFRTDSSWSYGFHYPKYADIITHWVVSNTIFRWYPEGLDHLHNKNCTIWLYTSAQAIDTCLLATAIWPLICTAVGVEGFNFWNNIDGGPNWHITPSGNGMTSMYYPGDRLFGIEGPIPTIRLKVLRNSMQVAESMEQWIRNNGVESRKEMTKLVGSILAEDQTFDWPEPPAEIIKPPYEWLEEGFSEVKTAAYHEGSSPEVFLELKEKLWKLLG